MADQTRQNGQHLQDGQVAAIEADLQRTREDLAQTIDQLTAKAKPKRSTLVGAAAAVAGVVAAVVVLRTWKARRR